MVAYFKFSGLILLIFSTFTSYAQTRITGTITEAQTGEALIGAHLVLLNTAYGAASDLNGNYVLHNVQPGKYTLYVSYIGYETREIPIEIVGDKSIRFDVQMNFSGSIDIEEVTITAQAKGQIAAINEQLSAREIKNVVSADRMQELPDANAAESVGRLPGVSILRVGGEANKVVIRGLSPKYSKVLIDGVEMSSTSGSDRSVDMSMISPFSLNGIEVVKAITPDADGDFIGGTVNFKLQKAAPGFHKNFVIQGGYNGLKNSYKDYLLVGSVSNRFFNNKLGIFFQVNAEKRDRSSNNMDAYYYMIQMNQDKVDPVYTGGVGLTDVIREKRRYGNTLVFDYNIPNGSITFNNFLSMGTTKSQSYNEYYASNVRTFNQSTNDSKNELRVLNNVLDYNQEFRSFKIDAKLAHSYSENNTPYNVSFNFNQTSALDAVPIDTKPSDVPKYATNIDYNKLYLWDIGDSKNITKSRQLMAAVNVEWEFRLSEQINGSLKLGGKYRHLDRFYDLESSGGILGFGGGGDVIDVILEDLGKVDDIGQMTLIPFTYFMNEAFKHKDFLKGEYELGPVVDTDVMRSVIEAMRNIDNETLLGYSYQEMNSFSNDYSGNENLGAGYIMADINLTSRLQLIPGVRYENNVTRYTGVQGNSSAQFPQKNYPHIDTTTVRENGLWLPMAHLRYKPFQWLLIHFAYTNTLSRPDFNILIPRRDINAQTVVQNNYNILPERSENFDLFFSFHENHIGLFAIGGFTKTIKDKIFWMDKRALLNPVEYGLSPSLINRMIITQNNFEDPVKIRGIEMEWQTNFWYLPGLLKGLVFSANYTHITSEVKYPKTIVESKYEFDEDFNLVLIQSNNDTTYTDRMIDQPNNIVNLSLGYDYKGFSFRLSMLYQSDIFSSPNFNPELRIFTDDYLRWDLSLKQNLPWKGAQIYCNVNNLNGAIDILVNEGSNYPVSMQHYGATIAIGFRLTL